MARTNHTQRSGSSKEEEENRQAKPATPQALEQRKPAPLVATDMLVNPFGLLSEFMGDMNRMLGGFAFPVFPLFGSGLGTASPNQAELPRATWAPPLEVLTRDGHFLIRTEIPGIDKEHVSVEIDDARAIISGEREEEREANREGVYRNERHYGRFSRVVTLPKGANAEQAQAMFADGILEIDIPMASEHQAHRLEIHRGKAMARGNGEQQKAKGQPHTRKRPQPQQGRKRGGTAAARASHGR